MRWTLVSITAIALILSTAAKATIVSIPLFGSVEILGPYQSDQYGPVNISVPISFTANIPGLVYPGTPDTYGAYVVTVTVFSGLGLSFVGHSCGNNVPGGHCRYQDFLYPQYLDLDHMTLSATASISTFGNYFDPGSLRDQVFVTADLPDGFQVAAVPEPTTWVMLLIGFAGIGPVIYRKRRLSYGVPQYAF